MVLGQNKSFHLSQRLKCSCKYLTYKEWKLSSNLRNIKNIKQCEYLTYKEWKPLGFIR